MYDLNTKEEIQITPTEYALVDSPVIWGARIVWEDYRNTYPDIYIYDLNTEEEIQITNDPQEQVYAEIWENRIVWNEYDHTTKNSYIYMYDLNTKEKIQISHIGTAGLMVFTRPVIWGDKIVWSGWNYETKNYDIYMYDLKTKEEIQITSDSREQLFPDIWGNRIVWQDYRNGQPEIYMYDLTTKEETRITTNLFKQTSPSIYEHWIFWDDHTKGDDDIDIYMYDLNTKEEIQITGAPNQQIYARRWENKIIWQDNRSGSWNIYLAEILPEERRTLTGIITGTGSGKVNVNPPDTDYTTNFTETYYVGTTVALTATPDAGSYFTGWSGDCSSRGSCNLTMDSDKKVIATFDKQVCTDSDGGRNYYLKGITCVGNYCETDFCLYPIELGYDLLNEYYCEGNEINAEIYPCVNGCKNGACFKEKPLTITSPHGGEKWQWGKTYDITWMANQIQEVKIDLYQEGGYYRTLVESWPAERERYSWEISHDIPLADNYQIRISDRENPEIYDKSKGYFGVVLAVYNLQVWLGGPGSGKVIGEGIYCKPDCSEDYFFSTPVHLEAIPDSGSIFEGWSGDCSGNQQGCELRMEADKVVRATFTFGICVGEGETVPVIPSPPECCSGLMLIPPKDPEIVGITGICTAKCGNGVCDTETESSYNCPADCK